jgi:hypothetical protein
MKITNGGIRLVMEVRPGKNKEAVEQTLFESGAVSTQLFGTFYSAVENNGETVVKGKPVGMSVRMTSGPKDIVPEINAGDFIAVTGFFAQRSWESKNAAPGTSKTQYGVHLQAVSIAIVDRPDYWPVFGQEEGSLEVAEGTPGVDRSKIKTLAQRQASRVAAATPVAATTVLEDGI